jgi:CheY-like chemotaxis protein
VIVITGHEWPGARSACLDAGASQYLRKPVDGRALIAAIADAIVKARSARM